ncbi:unannotated protein [freshwater metagenome]|uniref:Unannotated protein n=1 Tax=freshwater metagenome TaxID=449393 RepID=A0A6J6FMD4_9ZZZZ
MLRMSSGMGREPFPNSDSTAAIANVALSAWWRPCNVTGTSRYAAARPRICITCPPTAEMLDINSKPSPSTKSSPSIIWAAATISAIASGSCADETTMLLGLMIPALVRAISEMVLPRNSAWSIPMGVKTATSASATFVESHAPPIPTSRMATSTGASAKAASVRTVSVSKYVSGTSPLATRSSSTMLM